MAGESAALSIGLLMLGAGASTPHSSNAITELLRYKTQQPPYQPNFLRGT